MSLKVHVHVKPGFCMIDTIGRIVEKGLIGSKRSIVVEIRLRRVAVSFAQQRFLFLFRLVILEHPNIKWWAKRIHMNLLCKRSQLKSNFALILFHLNPALNNHVLVS